VILTVTLNPSVDHALFVEELKIGDTNRVLRTERDAGGKGVNLARVAAELGAKTLATGFLGGGPGEYVRSVLEKQGVSHFFIEVEGETRINFSVEDKSEGCPTTFNERGPEIDAEDMDKLFMALHSWLEGVRWMTLGGSLPPGVDSDIFAKLIRFARQHDVRIALDADGEALKFGIEAGPHFIKPNSKEASRVLGRAVVTPTDALEASSILQAQLKSAGTNDPFVVISLGENGAVMACKDGLFRGQTPDVNARSTIGSGDSMVAGILWAIEEGKSLAEALQWGLACGAATATTDGSEIARKPKVLELLPLARVEAL
jgi:1-phosphofructokinase family hexose kinase